MNDHVGWTFMSTVENRYPCTGVVTPGLTRYTVTPVPGRSPA